jgi:glutamate-1-semialdehyde 2,1-aminomutase
VKDEASAKKSNTTMFRKMFDDLLNHDIFIPPSQFETCFVSYSHSEDDSDRAIDAFGDALSRIKR